MEFVADHVDAGSMTGRSAHGALLIQRLDRATEHDCSIVDDHVDLPRPVLGAPLERLLDRAPDCFGGDGWVAQFQFVRDAPDTDEVADGTFGFLGLTSRRNRPDKRHPGVFGEQRAVVVSDA